MWQTISYAVNGVWIISAACTFWSEDVEKHIEDGRWDTCECCFLDLKASMTFRLMLEDSDASPPTQRLLMSHHSILLTISLHSIFLTSGIIGHGESTPLGTKQLYSLIRKCRFCSLKAFFYWMIRAVTYHPSTSSLLLWEVITYLYFWCIRP